MEAKMIGRRIGALLMTVLLVASMTVSAFAAQTSRRTIYGGNAACAVVYTGAPTSGWKTQTQVIVQNKGSRAITVYNPVGYANAYVGGVRVQPGCCRTFYVKGNYKNFYVTVQASGGTSQVQVVTSRGSAWWG